MRPAAAADPLRLLAGRCGLLQRRCLLCCEPAEPADGLQLCADCQELLAPCGGGFCPHCGEMQPDTAAAPALCSLCRERAAGLFTSRPWDGFCFYAAYQGVLRACILAYKMRGRLGLGALLQGLMLEGWSRNGHLAGAPDIIIPVPLHPRRLRMRGFNQSLELARPVARKTGRPLAPRALRRTRPTTPQFQLEPSQRASNIKGAFAADSAQVRGRRVLLVDDIMTTGATLEECARVLLEAGAAGVGVLVLARTARP